MDTFFEATKKDLPNIDEHIDHFITVNKEYSLHYFYYYIFRYSLLLLTPITRFILTVLLLLFQEYNQHL